MVNFGFFLCNMPPPPPCYSSDVFLKMCPYDSLYRSNFSLCTAEVVQYRQLSVSIALLGKSGNAVLWKCLWSTVVIKHTCCLHVRSSASCTRISVQILLSVELDGFLPYTVSLRV
jgi:hypothetical protein